MIYFDHASMTYPVHAALEAYRTAPFGNPSSEHAAGHSARAVLEAMRSKIAEFMDCEPDEVYFTSTATEASALAIGSLASSCYKVWESPFEHHAVSENIDNYWAWDRNPIGSAYAQMLANNETGEIFCVKNLHEKYKYVFCDSTSAVGHIPVSFKTLGCDYLIADAIKFGGLPGAAFLIAKKGAPLSPLIRGGGQERGMRAGTENVPAICAMAAALQWQTEHMEETIAHIAGLQILLYELLSEIPNHKWNTPLTKPHLPHILNVSFDGVDGKALALILSNEGVMVSTGAACSNGLNEPSHVLMAMFRDEARARSAIRISLSHTNTAAECEDAAKKISAAVSYLRSLS